MTHWTDARLRANPPKGNGKARRIADRHPDAPKGASIRVTAKGSISYNLRQAGRTWSWPWPEVPLSEARADALTIRSMTLRGEHPTKDAARAQRGAMTMPELWRSYQNSDSWHQISPATQSAYESAWRVHLRPVLGELPVHQVTPQHVRQVLERRPKSKRLLWALMGILFGHAQMDLGIDADPTRFVRPPRVGAPRRRVASTEELRTVVRALDKYADRDMRDCVMLIIYQGLRRSEPCELTWGDVDFEARTLRIRRHKSKGVSGDKTLPLNDASIRVLRERPQGEVWEPIFDLKPTNLTRRWMRLRAKIGLEDLCLHDLRRTFATRAVASGVGIKELSNLLGHSSSAVTERVYAVPLAGAHTQASQTVGALLHALVQGESRNEQGREHKSPGGGNARAKGSGRDQS